MGYFLENCHCAIGWFETLNELFVKIGSNYSDCFDQQKRNKGVVMGEMPICNINMFVAKRNIIGKVDILLAVFLGEYNNASQFFRMEIP